MICRRHFMYKIYKNGNKVLLNRIDYNDLVFTYDVYFKVKLFIIDELKKGNNIRSLIHILDILDSNDKPLYIPFKKENEDE